MAKKTFTKEQIIAAYAVLRTSNTDKLTVTDRLKVSDILRMMRPILRAHKEDIAEAENTLKPEALTEIEVKVKEESNLTQLDMVRSSIFKHEHDEAKARYERQRLAEEHELDIITFDKACLDKFIEANPGWTPEQLMVVIDVLG